MSLKRKPICALLAVLFTGCASDLGQNPNTSGDFDPFAADEANLTALDGTCTFNTTTGVATLDASAASGAQTIIVAKRAVDSALMVNGTQCGTATTLLLKKLNVVGGAQNEKLILDFQNGVWGTGTTSGEGINIDLAAGTNSLGIRGGAANDTIAMGLSGTDKGIATNTDANKDIVVKASTISTTTVSLGDGNDTFTTAGGNGTTGVYGAAVTVYGGAGNDTFNQGTAATPGETIYGGTGTDTVTYASRTAAVTVSYGQALGPASADDGDPTYNSNAGEDDDIKDDVDVVVGSAYADTLTGPTLVSAVTSAGTTPPVLTTTVTAAPTAGNYRVECTTLGALTTWVFRWSSDGGSTWNTGVTSAATVALGATGITLNIAAGNAAVNNVWTFTVGASGVTLTGGAGNDTITGGGGNDTINGDAGDDRIIEVGTNALYSGADVFNGGAGNDLLDYSMRTTGIVVTMNGTTADDGESGETDKVMSDVEDIYGSTVADNITGNASNNVITGYGGADTLDGGAGDDTFKSMGTTTSDGDDTITGGSGVDTVDYSTYTTTVTVALTADGTADGSGGLVDGDPVTGGAQAEADVIKADVENVNGGTAGDTITGSPSANELFGAGGNDTITGLAGDDLIDGGAGTDVVDCGAGDGDIAMNAETATYCEL
jgi:Ca2+-binding RTX toxin-like protein